MIGQFLINKNLIYTTDFLKLYEYLYFIMRNMLKREMQNTSCIKYLSVREEIYFPLHFFLYLFLYFIINSYNSNLDLYFQVRETYCKLSFISGDS